MHKKRQPTSAQTMLEYLLLMSLVAFLVFSSFKSNGILDLTRQATNEYFSSGTRAIMGGYYDPSTGKPTFENPSPVNGGWCPWTECINGMQTRECACPRAAFGGEECEGAALNKCAGGPSMKACPSGKGLIYVPGEGCVCPSGLTWSNSTESCEPCVPDGSCDAAPPECGQTTYGKDNCGGPCDREGDACPIKKIDGGWCAWGDCGGACPNGTQTRICNCPAPSGGGADCAGPASQACSLSPCCGDGLCNGADTCANCVPDCGACPPPIDGGWCDWSNCGGTCPNGTQNRVCNCPAPANGGANCSGPSSQACSLAPCCGDGSCDAGEGETCATCEDDCGVCPYCGDTICNGTEDCATCDDDCGECPPVCGDGKCNGTENCATCPDCKCPLGRNGMGYCNMAEDPPSCVCTPDCALRFCGSDGCFSTCEPGCSGYYPCVEATGQCVCIGDCTGKECGGDGCSGSCGDCGGQNWRCENNKCICFVGETRIATSTYYVSGGMCSGVEARDCGKLCTRTETCIGGNVWSAGSTPWTCPSLQCIPCGPGCDSCGFPT